ncbi:MAG: glucans biosynthesis glucosyltransferase MdoH [Pseudomonadota bacterium]
MTRYAYEVMPARAPLPMAPQAFEEAPAQRGLSLPSWRVSAWRSLAFGPALALSIVLSTALARGFTSGGISAFEALIVVLVGVSFVWVALSVSTALIGLARRAFAPCTPRFSPSRGLAKEPKVALLMPIYNEVPWDVFGNASAMLAELTQGRSADRFTFFVLSDTQDPNIANLEERAFWALKASAPVEIDIYYRRRAKNTDKKVGNLTDWIEHWGGAHEAMIVLDADSLMSGAAIRHLAHELSADDQAGLIQSVPVVIGAQTVFGRMHQFSNAVYGWLLAEGLALWSSREGNYWGHNAIIRTRAFAAAARLPYLRGPKGQDKLILSHDFVEAGLLRRAGWAVRFLPRMGGSFEQSPQTLRDYALRDRRWCQGNLQHLRLLAARGFHPVTRFHLLQGAVAFLLSPAWLALIVIWAWVGMAPMLWDAPQPSYFSPISPLHPIWPDMPASHGPIFLAVIYGMLLLPKLMGAFALGMRADIRKAYGGAAPFAASTALEIGLSVLFAPVMMVQQSQAVGRALLGLGPGWGAQARSTENSGTWRALLQFHWMETLLGAGLAAGIATGYISFWLAPIALSLTGAAGLAKLGAIPLKDGPTWWRLPSPQSLREPRVVTRARRARADLKSEILAPAPSVTLAAE